MAGDPFKNVLAGEPLVIPAEAYNAWNAAARAHLSRKHNVTASVDRSIRQPEIVRVQNMTGSPVSRFAVLALSQPIVSPDENLLEFQNKVNFEGHVPQAPGHCGRFAILLEPLAADAIGRGVVAGVAPVRLFVDPGQLYDFAEIEPGSTAGLRNVPAGSARVLWVEPNGGSERWAIVRIDQGDFEAHVFILSNLPDADGYFPGEVQRYDVTTKTWLTLFPCKVLDINQ